MSGPLRGGIFFDSHCIYKFAWYAVC